jgi:sporulation protein YlmC with PRC-barrel domain
MDALSELERYVVHGVDGDVGRIEDVYFDDQYWVVRHLVVDSRHWLRGRRVLIPPAAVGALDRARGRVELPFTRARIEQSPRIDTAKPVSRQHHVDLYSYFGFPYDWKGPAVHRDPLAGFGGGDPHLRSARAVTTYRVQAVDGDVGQLDDLLIETESWAIRHIVVRSGRRLGDRRVLLPPEWIARVSWEGRLLETNRSLGHLLASSSFPGETRSKEARAG